MKLKNHFVFFFVTFLILIIISPVLFVHALDYEVVSSWALEDGGKGYSYQQNSFKFNGTYWEFYLDADTREIRYRYRETNDTWIEPNSSPLTNSSDPLENVMENTDFSVFFDNSTFHRVYVAYVIYDTHTLYNGLGYDYLYFQRGQINNLNITWDSRSEIQNYASYFGTFNYVDVACDSNGYPYVTYLLDSYDDYLRCANNDKRDGSGSWSVSTLRSEDTIYYGALIQLPNLDMGCLISDFPTSRALFYHVWNNSLSTWVYQGRPAGNINLGYDFDVMYVNNFVHVAYVNTSHVLQSTSLNITSNTWGSNLTIVDGVTYNLYPSLTRAGNTNLQCFYLTNNVIYYSQLSTVWGAPTELINVYGSIPYFFGSHYNTSSVTLNDVGISWNQITEIYELRFFIYGGTPAVTVGWLPIMFILGIIGLLSIFYGLLYGVYKIKKKDYREGLVNATVIISIGSGLVLSWLWSI